MVKLLGRELGTPEAQKAIKGQIHADWITHLRTKFGTQMVGMKVLATMFLLLAPALFGISVLGIWSIVDIELMMYFQDYVVQDLVFAWVRVIIGFAVMPMVSMILFLAVSWWSAQRFKDIVVWRVNLRDATTSVSAMLDLHLRKPTPMRQVEKGSFPKGFGVYLSDEIEEIHQGPEGEDLQKKLDKHIDEHYAPDTKKKVKKKLGMERSRKVKWAFRFLKFAILIAIAISIQVFLLHFFEFDLLAWVLSFIPFLGMAARSEPQSEPKDMTTEEAAELFRDFELGVEHLDLSKEEDQKKYVQALITLQASHTMLQNIVTRLGLQGWVNDAEEAMEEAKRLSPKHFLNLSPVYATDIRNDVPFIFVFPTNMETALGEPEHVHIMTPDGFWTATVPLFTLGGVLIDIYGIFNHMTGQQDDTTVVQITYCAFLDQVQSHGLCLYDFGFPLFGAQLSKKSEDKRKEKDNPAKKDKTKKDKTKKDKKKDSPKPPDDDSDPEQPEYGAEEYMKDVKASSDQFLSNRLVLLLHKAVMAFKDVWPRLTYFMYGEATIRQEMAGAIVEEQNDLGKGWGRSTRESVFKRIPTSIQAAIIFMVIIFVGFGLIWALMG